MGAFFWGDFGCWLQRGGESLKTSDFLLDEGFPGLTNIASYFLTLTQLYSHSQLSFWASIFRFGMDRKSHLFVLVEFILPCACSIFLGFLYLSPVQD